MGRPPIGKVAMSDAERQRKRRERLAGKGSSIGRVTEPSPHVTKQTALRATEPSHRWPRERPTRDAKHIRRLEDRVRELEALVLPLDAEGKDAVKQHRRRIDREFKQRCKLHDELIKKRTVIMDERTYAGILAGLHPDASREIRDRSRALLEPYKKRVFTKKDTAAVKWPPAKDGTP